MGTGLNVGEGEAGLSGDRRRAERDKPFSAYHPVAKFAIIVACGILAAIALALALLLLGLIVAAAVTVWGWVL